MLKLNELKGISLQRNRASDKKTAFKLMPTLLSFCLMLIVLFKECTDHKMHGIAKFAAKRFCFHC